jgi:hypothetical protein
MLAIEASRLLGFVLTVRDVRSNGTIESRDPEPPLGSPHAKSVRIAVAFFHGLVARAGVHCPPPGMMSYLDHFFAEWEIFLFTEAGMCTLHHLRSMSIGFVGVILTKPFLMHIDGAPRFPPMQLKTTSTRAIENEIRFNAPWHARKLVAMKQMTLPPLVLLHALATRHKDNDTYIKSGVGIRRCGGLTACHGLELSKWNQEAVWSGHSTRLGWILCLKMGKRISPPANTWTGKLAYPLRRAMPAER